MIRAVQEYFSVYGRCREVVLGDGHRSRILLSVTQMREGAQTPGVLAGHAPRLRIQYRGRREDLMALGCICRERLAAARHGHLEDDPRGALWHVRPVPGRRSLIELSCLTQSRSVAGSLPAVRTYCADWLAMLTAPPALKLVVDNRRREAGKIPAEAACETWKRPALRIAR